MRVLYFGTYDRAHPRNAQVISALRGAGVEVREQHRPVWEGRATTGRPGCDSCYGSPRRSGACAVPETTIVPPMP